MASKASYCEVLHVEASDEALDPLWYATCVDGSHIVFPRMIQKGAFVYFLPYSVEGDTTNVYGFPYEIQ